MYSHHSSKGTNAADTPAFKLNDVLVEIDGWRLVRPLFPAMLGVKSYIVHTECQGEKRSRGPRSVQSVGAHAGVKKGWAMEGCVRCGKLPPAELVGLEILHNGGI